MSHYNALVLIDPDTTDIKAEITRIIQPYFSDREGNETPRVWDWWRIGGRWDGMLLSDRKTWESEPCAICSGDGVDAIHHHYTDAHEQPSRNVVPVGQLPEDCHVYSLWADGEFITQNMWEQCEVCRHYFNDEDAPYEGWSEHSKTHPSDEPDELWLPKLRQFLVEHGQDKLAVCIDYHN